MVVNIELTKNFIHDISNPYYWSSILLK